VTFDQGPELDAEAARPPIDTDSAPVQDCWARVSHPDGAGDTYLLANAWQVSAERDADSADSRSVRHRPRTPLHLNDRPFRKLEAFARGRPPRSRS
jgi:hypothetical protein